MTFLKKEKGQGDVRIGKSLAITHSFHYINQNKLNEGGVSFELRDDENFHESTSGRTPPPPTLISENRSTDSNPIVTKLFTRKNIFAQIELVFCTVFTQFN
jgi:hypothetical protein